ncbi:ComEC/Rec2 family competence protein [uncultured Oscillibacter sp.]|uniref:ComEC/Rec2 family competence protein n=1 Tax=uncultured Oscillibacter sp. TaxID=876091 RepID=UPI0025F747CA|nr:MBL fold metallo-hydrolase [uncultured Oscillibacter sp.]
MLVLDFINVGNGDSILIQELEGGRRRFAMLVDCGHDRLIRDDHPAPTDPRSQRIYAGDFLKKQGIDRLDILLATHFHRDHIGGLGRVLAAAEVDRLMATYVPPEGSAPLDPDGDNDLPGAARNLLRCLDIYASALREAPGRVREFVEIPGDKVESLQLTEELRMEIYAGEPALYPRQKEVYDAAFRGERDRFALMRWTKAMNISSLRQRLFYHGKEIVLGGDMYCIAWDNETLTPCDILKVPHHASLSSCSRKAISRLAPKTMVVSVAAGRPDERPHPYIVSLLREYTGELYFTDAVDIPGLVEPEFHESVHIEVE